LATAGPLAALPWSVAAEKVRRLGEAARLAAAPLDESLAAIDPRAVDKRTAALGRYEPNADRPAGRASGLSGEDLTRPKAQELGERCGPDGFT
jgi:hypothetical protein